jgi:hypothetical protein
VRDDDAIAFRSKVELETEAARQLLELFDRVDTMGVEARSHGTGTLRLGAAVLNGH